MKNRFLLLLLAIFTLSISACNTGKKLPLNSDDGIIEFRIIQLNDVYEIAPIQNGAYGGMARVASYVDKHDAEQSNTLTVLSGDFLNPSLLGTIKVEGKRIKGEQMVDLMNAAGIDLVCFGNHEFDLDEDELQERINESQFDWVSTDIWQKCGDRHYPFYKEVNGKKEFFPETYHWEIKDDDGTMIKVGFFGVCVPSNPVDYVHYGDYEKLAIKAANELQKSSDIVLGLTHLEIDQDMALAPKLNNVPLLLGGHDHENMIHEAGNTRITKADANAKTVYAHYFRHDKNTGQTTIKSELVEINKSIPEDPQAAALVTKWMKIQDENLKLIIDDPYEVIYSGTETLDGLEASIRNKQTNMGDVFTKACLAATNNDATAAIINSGGIRIDDRIGAPILALDIFRALPFGGKLVDIEIKGFLLKKVLDEGEDSAGTGAYLQRQNIKKNRNGDWEIGKKKIKDDKVYPIILNDFLLMGRDIPILTSDHPGITKIIEPEPESLAADMRKAIIAYMKENN